MVLLPTIFEDTPHNFAVEDFPQCLKRLTVPQNKKTKTKEKESRKNHLLNSHIFKANDNHASTQTPVGNLHKTKKVQHCLHSITDGETTLLFCTPSKI